VRVHKFYELNWQYDQIFARAGIWTPELTEVSGGKTLRERGVTMVTPVYNNSEFEKARFRRKFDEICTWHGQDLDAVHHIFVDDGSPSPLVDMLDGWRRRALNFNLTIYRIKRDIKWNTPGALNLGMSQAPTDWRICWDSDCSMTRHDAKLFLDCDPDPKFYYGLSGIRFRKSQPPLWYYMTHGCFLVTKEQFDKIHGFDEDFTGEYSGGYAHFDNHFQWKLGKALYPQLIPVDPQIVDDDRLTADNPGYNWENMKPNKRLFRGKQRGTIPESADMIRFEWEKVFEWRR